MNISLHRFLIQSYEYLLAAQPEHANPGRDLCGQNSTGSFKADGICEIEPPTSLPFLQCCEFPESAHFERIKEDYNDQH